MPPCGGQTWTREQNQDMGQDEIKDASTVLAVHLYPRQLHALSPSYSSKMNVEEYTREFEKLMIKCDIHEPEEQTMVCYLGGLDPKIANVVKLQAYTTFDEVCVLAHKVEQQRKSRMNVRDSFKPYSVSNHR